MSNIKGKDYIEVRITELESNFTTSNAKITTDINTLKEDVSNGFSQDMVDAGIQKKIDDGTIANLTIEDASITGEKIADGTITPIKLSNSYSDSIIESGKSKNKTIKDALPSSIIKLKSSEIFYVGNSNFYNIPDTVETTENGITYSISNGVITLNGTASANTTIYLTQQNSFNIYKDYYYVVSCFKDSGTITSGSVTPKFRCSSTYKMYSIIDLTPININGNLVGKNITGITEDFLCDRMAIHIPNGTIIDNLAIRLQVELNEYSGSYDYGTLPIKKVGEENVEYFEGIKIQGNSLIEYKYSKSINNAITELKDYNNINNKPLINGVELKGDNKPEQLGLLGINGIVTKKYNKYKEDTSLYTVNILASPNTSILYPSLIDNIENGEINDLYTYSSPIKVGDSFPKNKGVTQDTPRLLGMSIEWYANCSEIDIKVYEKSKCVVIVDGVVVAENVCPEVVSGLNYINIVFGSKAKRHIELLYSGNSFQGCLCDGEISKYDNKKPLLIVDGDSIVEGQAGGLGAINSQAFCWASIVSQRMGWNILNCGVGGSGYVATGNMGEPNMVDRFDSYIKPYLNNNTVLITSGGLNDTSSSATLEEIKSSIDTYWVNVKNIDLTPYVIMMSPFNPSKDLTGVANLQEINEYLRLKAIELEYPYIDIMNGKTYDATGSLISERGQFITEDNVSTYISTDNCHPTKEGHKALGNYISMEIFRILKDNYGLLNV